MAHYEVWLDKATTHRDTASAGHNMSSVIEATGMPIDDVIAAIARSAVANSEETTCYPSVSIASASEHVDDEPTSMGGSIPVDYFERKWWVAIDCPNPNCDNCTVQQTIQERVRQLPRLSNTLRDAQAEAKRSIAEATAAEINVIMAPARKAAAKITQAAKPKLEQAESDAKQKVLSDLGIDARQPINATATD